jgi:hypothetical protein
MTLQLKEQPNLGRHKLTYPSNNKSPRTKSDPLSRTRVHRLEYHILTLTSTHALPKLSTFISLTSNKTTP